MDNQYRRAPAEALPPSISDVNLKSNGMEAAPIKKFHQFYISHYSQLDGANYEGQFTCKKLTVKDLAQVNVRKTQLNGGYHYSEKSPGVGVDEDTDTMNAMIAHLEKALVQIPLWFKLDDIYDAELLGKIYKNVAEFEHEFFRRMSGEVGPPGVSQANSVGESEKSGASGHIAKVGGREVQDSLDA